MCILNMICVIKCNSFKSTLKAEFLFWKMRMCNCDTRRGVDLILWTSSKLIFYVTVTLYFLLTTPGATGMMSISLDILFCQDFCCRPSSIPDKDDWLLCSFSIQVSTLFISSTQIFKGEHPTDDVPTCWDCCVWPWLDIHRERWVLLSLLSYHHQHLVFVIIKIF